MHSTLTHVNNNSTLTVSLSPKLSHCKDSKNSTHHNITSEAHKKQVVTHTFGQPLSQSSRTFDHPTTQQQKNENKEAPSQSQASIPIARSSINFSRAISRWRASGIPGSNFYRIYYGGSRECMPERVWPRADALIHQYRK